MLKFLKIWFNKKPTIKVQPDFYPVVCPYCFNKFDTNQVVFRATHNKDDDQDYALQEDELLNKYRSKFNLDSIDEIEAVIDPNSIPNENKIYSNKVLIGLTDRFGIVTRKRLCPYCHNDLPITAGKAPSNIISIVGATAVGKSVYMTSLIHTLQNQTAANFSAACLPLNADISRRFRMNYEEPLFEQGRMLDATQKEVLQEPYIFQFKFKDDSIAPLTLVFFDVAGEGMTDEEHLDLYASHIRNSTGILFMVDPLQIRSIRDRIMITAGKEEGEFVRRYDEPREVILTMYQNFIGHEDNGKTNIPTAIVLTKSDMLQYLKEEDGKYIRTTSNIFNNFIHSKFFNLTEFENISGEIQQFIKKVDSPFKDSVDVNFTEHAYFAVSALGGNPIKQKLEDVINPVRVDEPFIWLLYKLGYIEGRYGA